MFNSFRPVFLSVLRILVAWAFLLHGTSKFFGWPTSMGGTPEFLSIFWFAGVLEIVGGAFLILGLFSRPWAFLLSGQMAYAYFFVHASAKNWLLPVANGGEAAMLFCLIFFYIFLAGSGPISLDHVLKIRIK
ncbi:DoxX family protein [Basilea psittacipulmonis]|uniref:LuxR family transcriptional regulator n=1 Tax=Basilea psittacipulmonis DSM 24701 TaxID=1072685 RepID=A0A077DFL1_9BURK|nr:DoxX family protein [Basilea psittacipulmonis]AIL32961.1 LuxR family transcriptional regulator [Basilea psittacipulmonis DSM 24701]